MKTLKMRIHPVTVVLALLIVGFAVFIMYDKRFKGEDAAKRAMAERQMGGRARPAAAYDAGLGAQLMPNIGEPRGDKVVGFRAGSPLRRLGCQQGDILVSCNGEAVAGSKVKKAMEDLEKKGTPLVLVVYRGGVKKEMKYTKMPPEPPKSPPPSPPTGGKP